MSALAFLTPDAASGTVLAHSPMEGRARAAGASIEPRAGWNVAASYAVGADRERERLTETVAFADRSDLTKLEVQAEPEALAAVIHEATGGAVVLEPRRGRARGRRLVVSGDAVARARAGRCGVRRGRPRQAGGDGRCCGNKQQPRLGDRRDLRARGVDSRRPGERRAAGAVLCDRCAPVGDPRERLSPRVGRAHAGISAARARGPAAGARRLGAGGVSVGSRRRRGRASRWGTGGR